MSTQKPRYSNSNLETPSQRGKRLAIELRDRKLITPKIPTFDAPFGIVSCDTFKLLSTHKTYEAATKAIEDTCDIVLWHPVDAVLYVPMPVRSCDAGVTWKADNRNPATISLGNVGKSASNKAEKENNAGANV